jgi:hypothetical protein
VILAALAAAAMLAVAENGARVAADGPETPVIPAATEVTLPVSVRVIAVDGLMEGDSSMDGATNIIDAMFIAQYTVGLRGFDGWQLECADTNDDGVVNIVDAMHIAQYTVDPTGSAGILFEDLWQAGDDDGMLPPA